MVEKGVKQPEKARTKDLNTVGPKVTERVKGGMNKTDLVKSIAVTAKFKLQ
jgi:hypothetical protein